MTQSMLQIDTIFLKDYIFIDMVLNFTSYWSNLNFCVLFYQYQLSNVLLLNQF